MSSQSEVMHCYEQIATLAEQMLSLARTCQWGELPAHEAMYSGMVDRLRQIEPLESLHEEQIGRKYLLLSRIATHQDEISSLVMPQLRHLGEMMRNLEQQESLHKVYGQHSDIRM
ncbi:flagellar protein FliT [Polaromonas sp. CG_9.11]|uniref:flagellar protein FliT n=1 Tax=Polaromonas sp. CG_9.11 TaxID=2787730 RepID=UPI0018CA6CF4|nr:flagellar protein FliT [Polaromonas sp. CG_9.11]MBG6077618.1 flagellar protein FliT [Polaromonas sp. CG_9.11]